MAEDARAEAERVVDHALDTPEHYDRLVAALAAAIEARDAYYDAAVHGDLCDDDATPRRRRLATSMSELHEHLSALHAPAGDIKSRADRGMDVVTYIDATDVRLAPEPEDE